MGAREVGGVDAGGPSGWRLVALVTGLLGAVLIELGVPSVWIRVHRLLDPQSSIGGIGFDLDAGEAIGLPSAWRVAMVALGVLVAACTLVTLLPAFRFAAIGAIAAGATALVVGAAVLLELLGDDKFSGRIGRSDVDPGSGPYVAAFGGLLGVTAGVVNLCTRRTIGPTPTSNAPADRVAH